MASKEIELLENVELRFALAETDVQLEKTLNIFLSPVLLKLASPHEEVRKKVIDVLTHINKRVRPKNDIKLPLIPLIDLVCTEKVTKSAFVKNFAIMYLEMAYNRLTEEDKITHLPSLIENISSRPPTQKQTLVHIILMSLQKFKPKLADSPSSLDPYNFKARSEDGKILLGSFLDVMLYNPLASQTPFGLSHKSVKFVTNDDKASWATKSADIKFVKMGILRFVNSPVIFPDSLSDDIHLARFLIFLVATCDSSHEVVDGGEDGLKKMKKPDLESRTVVNKLYSLYQGSGSGSDQSDKIFPASTALKLKIMNYLCKSEFATNTFPSMLQVSFDCFYASPPNTKLQKQGMSFVQWAARMASISKLKPIAPVLLSGLLKFINKDEEVLYGDHEQLLSFSYISISLLAKRVPELFRTDLSILSKFFSDLYSINNNNIRSSIQEALSNMIEAYQILDEWASADDIKTIENILEESVSKSVHQSRYCAVKYAVRLFPFSHTLSRYICLLASADEKLEVCEMASRGLSFPNSQTPKLYLEKQGEVKFPHFSNMVNLIHEKSFKRADDMSHQIYVLGYRSEVYINILRFLRHLMIVSADPTVPVDELGYALESESKIFDSNSRILVKNWIKEQWELDQRESTEEMDIDGNHGTLHIYLGLLEQGLSQGKFIDKTLQSTASSSLLEIISLGPSSLARSYENRLSWLKPFMSVQKLEVRNSMAHILGIVSTSELRDDPKRCALVQELIQEFISIGKDQSKRTSVDHHGSILVLGYIIGRLIYRYPSTYDSLVPASILAEAVKLIAEDLDSSETLNINGASKALGEIGRYTSNFAILRSPDSEEGASDGDKNSDTFIAIIDKLIGLVKQTKDTQETIIQALGHIAMGNIKYTESVLSLFYELSSLLGKQIEVHFTVGEVITCLTTGWESISLGPYLDISDASIPPIKIEPGVVEGVLNKIFMELLPSGKTVVKKVVCVWMLCLVKFSSKNETIKKSLSKIHEVFSLLLTDRDEFTQEVASKGIGLVYELGDQKVKEQLVDSLVSMLGEGKRPKETVENDTQLFDSNVLGQTPDGSAISTYQSILSLASDMNQPELVYKFMQLASHNAMWQSRKGAAFGFSSIIAQAEEELKPYLKDLIPRLYRFQYDPNPRVNEAMTSIWKSLVKEPKKIMEEYFETIVKDLLKSLGDRLWKTREASANALTDLLQGRSIQELEPFLQDLWNMCFRALDDIKESVRIAAFKTCRTLTKVTVKYCNPENVSVVDGQKFMKVVIPFLLTKGLLSDAEDVRKFSLRTILEICKTSKGLLKPHIAELVSTLLEGLSSMEPQVMNYLSFHVEKYEVTQEQLESTRLSAAKMSPMMEGIESCVDYIDTGVMEELTPKLLQLIRKGLGLPTKAGCARFLVTMTLKQATTLRPFADNIMKALSGSILDNSSAVRKSYAVAAGYVAHLSTDSTLIRFIGHLKKIYCDNSEQDIRSIAGITVLEISRHASDEMKRIYVEILPFAYYGMHDSDDGIKNVWTEVWDENTAGSTGAIKLYLKELIDLLSKLMESPSWLTKRQAAETIADVAKTIEQSLLPYMKLVLPLLINGLSGRTWVGKEALVQALATSSIYCKEYFDQGDSQVKLNEVSNVLIRES